MRLIGMLDSPYVRRVAVSLRMAGVDFEHMPLSVFGNFDEFAATNPVVKAPTLVTDNGDVLLDSSLILEYLDRIAPADRRLMPDPVEDFVAAQRAIGFALAACEKTVQIVYELNLRPADRQHQPWIDRVSGQLSAAYGILESTYAGAEDWLLASSRPLQPDITTAVAWRFTQETLPQFVPADAFPRLSALSRRAEALPAFQALPPG